MLVHEIFRGEGSREESLMTAGSSRVVIGGDDTIAVNGIASTGCG